MTQLRDVWKQLRESIVRGPRLKVTDLRLMPTGDVFPEGEALVGMTTRGVRHLLIPLPDATPLHSDTSSQGVHLEVRPLLENGTERVFLDVCCRVPELHDLFTVVAEDILQAGIGSPDDVVSVAAATLDRWRELLRQQPSRRLGRSGLVGLFGELVVLRDLARHTPGVLDAWKGPKGGRHDFVSTAGDIEVKTTTSHSARTFVVHGLGQLEAHGDLPLHLAFVRVVHPTASGTTLPELIDEIRGLGVPTGPLYESLSSAGYHVADVDEYRKERFELVEVGLYVVDGAFPRLTNANLTRPPGVDDIEYKVDLDSVDISPLDETTAATVISATATAGSVDA